MVSAIFTFALTCSKINRIGYLPRGDGDFVEKTKICRKPGIPDFEQVNICIALGYGDKTAEKGSECSLFLRCKFNDSRKDKILFCLQPPLYCSNQHFVSNF